MELATFVAVLASVLAAGTCVARCPVQSRLVRAPVRTDRRRSSDDASPVHERRCSW